MEGKNYNKVHQVTMHCTDKWNYEKGNSPVFWAVNKEGKRNGYEKTCTAENAVSYTHLDVYKRQAVRRPS